jgi:hypothetical protein
MDNPSLIGALAVFTLVAVLLVGAWELTKNRRKQAEMGEKPTGGIDTMTTRHKEDLSQ